MRRGSRYPTSYTSAVGISISADGNEQLSCTHIDSRSIRMQDRQRVTSSLALLGHCSSDHADRMPLNKPDSIRSGKGLMLHIPRLIFRQR
jgi:hypothetical protein